MDNMSLLVAQDGAQTTTKCFDISLRNIGLITSVALNSLLILAWVFVPENHHLVSQNNNEFNLTWTRKSAEFAEVASRHHCSGHGYVFPDSYRSNSTSSSLCECDACFQGPTCSKLVPDCIANSDSGDPTFLEAYWLKNKEPSASVTAGWYRMSYEINDIGSRQSPQLEYLIRRIHALVGNAVTNNKYIVFGVGSTQLINAAIHSLSRGFMSKDPVLVVAPAPYYNAYKLQTEMFSSLLYKWAGDSRMWANKWSEVSNSTKFVEMIASPNNPTTYIQNGVLMGPNVKSVYDRAYYWPYYTPITGPADEDVMLFTLSKLTGHAGSRFGWAIVKDYEVYKRMTEYVLRNTVGVSHDTQYRATVLLKSIVDSYEFPSNNASELIFEFGYGAMSRRWKRLEQIIKMSQRFSLQKIGPGFCKFFGRRTDPSPAYAWVKCEREEDEDCYKVMKSGGVIGRESESFGAAKRFVRLSMLKRDDSFEILLIRLTKLVFVLENHEITLLTQMPPHICNN